MMSRAMLYANQKYDMFMVTRESEFQEIEYFAGN